MRSGCRALFGRKRRRPGLATAGTFLVAGAVLAADAAVGAQQQEFRAVTRTVPVFTTVTDEFGQLVLDLEKEDFEVRDNGVLRPIAQFTRTQVPITATLLIDGSRSVIKDWDLLVGAADNFIVRLMPGDRVQIGSFAEDIRFGPGFLGDRDELVRFLRGAFNLRMGIRTLLWDAIDEAIQGLAPADSRRVIVVFTDGQDTMSVATPYTVTSHARRQDVMVYAVKVRPSTFEPRDRQDLQRAELRAAQSGTDVLAPRPADGSLDRLVRETGGGYYEIDVLSELNAVATQAAVELHSQYVLGFEPQRLDGKVHEIDVRVKKRGHTARARRTYLAAPGR